MTEPAPTPIPWLDREAYPFKPHVFETAHGRMHYVDEGAGSPVVLVHGTPTWSFLWRKLIRDLSKTHRVIAPDHLGFGLSDKPKDAPYRPEDHARRLKALLEYLELQDITLIVHDFGGSIGLAYAIEHPQNVRALVLFNTWLWSLADDPAAVRASKLLGSSFGKFLYTRLNLSPRFLLPTLYGDKSKLTPEIHQHYLRVFPNAGSRVAPWVLARELIGSSDLYNTLWEKRERLSSKPALLVWGEQDLAFGIKALQRWRQALPEAEVCTFSGAGHFVQEEEPEASAQAVTAFLRRVDVGR